MKTFIIAIAIIFLTSPVFAKSVAISKQVQGQGQTQGQAQNQGQNQAQNQVAFGGNAQANMGVSYDPSVTIEKTDPVISNSFNSRSYRPLPYADSPVNQPAPTLFYAPEKDSGPLFVNAGLLVELLNASDFGVVAKDDDIKIVVQPLKEVIAAECSKVTYEIIKKKSFDPNNVIAFVTIMAEDYVSSVGLAYRLNETARKYGASKVIFIKEGYIIEMRTTGKSFGLNPTVTSSYGAGTSAVGAVGAGGMGIASASGYYLKLPYLQAVLVK